MSKWECDGCHKVIEVDDTVMDAKDGGPRCSCPNFWGWMKVGGEAWLNYHDHSIHPMSSIVKQAAALLDQLKKVN
jgi:hypothetical protein